MITKVLNADYRRYKQNSQSPNELRRRPFGLHWVRNCLRNGEKMRIIFQFWQHSMSNRLNRVASYCLKVTSKRPGTLYRKLIVLGIILQFSLLEFIELNKKMFRLGYDICV